MLKKILVFIFSFLILNSLFTVPARADGEFLTDATVTYKVDEGGKTQVTHTFTIENLFSELYATSYTLNLENITPTNPKAFQGGKQLALSSTKNGDKTALTVTLDSAVVGKGKTQTFNLSFDEDSLATRTGEVWEITIPRLSGQNFFRSYRVILSIPSSFGKEAYISPSPERREEIGGRLVYYFDKENVAKAGITAGFGAFQVFSFTLHYHLENPLPRAASVDIAIPPDTAMQKIYYQVASPAPDNVHIDEDGNWLATYLLGPRQKVSIEMKGSVQIFAGPRPFPKPAGESLAENLKASEFWQTTDPEIKDLAKRLATPRAIYDFVTTSLSYDYQRVAPNVTRLGAKGALASPKNAICMEYTDLFIAIARSAGIPTREINGYAYTENPKVQPLSLVADVLHSWPEYWDAQRLAWVPVDPTWGSTTGGVDYFSKLDLRHFTFVIHGKDSQKPYPPGSYKLGANPQKDVFVSFGQLPEQRNSDIAINYVTQNPLPLMAKNLIVNIKNKGPAAVYNLKPTVSYGKEVRQEVTIEVLPPYGTYEFPVKIPFSFLGRDLPDNILISANSTHLAIPTYKNQVIIYNLIGLFTLFGVIILLILIRLKKIDLSGPFVRIWIKLRAKRG